MCALATETIALRAAMLTIVGIVALAAISGHTAHPSRSGRVSGWWILAILVAKGCLVLGPVGVALVVGREARGLGEGAMMALAGLSFLASYWTALVAVQFAQNLAYRRVGAPIQRVRWRVWTSSWLKRAPRRRARARDA